MTQSARDAVKGPATALVVCGVLGIFAALADAAMNGFMAVDGRLLPVWAHLAFIAFDAFMAGLYGWQVWAALRLRRLALGKNAAFAAAIIALLPCQACFCVSVGFGVWAMIVLTRAEVQEGLGGA